MQTCAALLAMIATGIHGGRQRLGMTKHAREQRNRHTAEHTHAAERASRHARTAAHLRIGRLLHLGGKLRHKAQRDTHDHAELVRRKSHTRKRREQALKARGEVERRCGERDSAHTGHHQGQAARHKGGGMQRALAYLQKAELQQNAPALVGKQVEHRDHRDDRQQRRHR